jgi:GDP-mannose 6-dehydrogenase
VKVGIIGFGYIGAVCGAALLQKGHTVQIFDIRTSHIDTLRFNKFTFPEADVENSFRQHSDKVEVLDHMHQMTDANVIIVCVNTEPDKYGRLDFKNLLGVIDSLDSCSYSGEVVIRSTLPMQDELLDCLENDFSFGLYVLPEFLREGSALTDLISSTNTIIGYQKNSARSELVESLFDFNGCQIHNMLIREAIFTKLLNNTWHALKVAFSNEWRGVAKDNGIEDYNSVYKAFISDTHLNVSEKYLRPGGPYGGPCLPKDIGEFSALAKSDPAFICNSTIKANDALNSRLADQVSTLLSQNNTSKFFFDTAEFKVGTADERYSPVTVIREILIDRGFEYDDKLGICISGRQLLDHGEVEKMIY